jgi:M6 family metalloprotease-like protein
MVFKVFVFLLGISSLTHHTINAAMASSAFFILSSPDHQNIHAQQKGNEHFNWIESSDGYVLKQGKKGYWHLLEWNTQKVMVLSKTLYRNRKLTAQPFILGSAMKKRWIQFRSKKSAEKNLQLMRRSSPKKLSFKNVGFSTPHLFKVEIAPKQSHLLFLLIDFNNQAATYLPSDFSLSLEKIKDYYKKTSLGNFKYISALENSGEQNDGVIGWIRLNRNHPNTGKDINIKNLNLAYDAIEASDDFIDYSLYDENDDGFVSSEELSIVIVVAGYEASDVIKQNSVWGHQLGMSGVFLDNVQVGATVDNKGGYVMLGEIHETRHQATIGIIAHELAHLTFGLPDLYDNDFSSEGIDFLGLMGAGEWGRRTQDAFRGETPVFLSAWSRKVLGWSHPLEGKGEKTLYSVGTPLSHAYNSLYKVSTQIPSDYFLIENRLNESYDQGLQEWLGEFFVGGVLIWHINDTQMNNDNEQKPLVAIESANGNLSLAQANFFWSKDTVSIFDAYSRHNSNNHQKKATGIVIHTLDPAKSRMKIKIRPSQK